MEEGTTVGKWFDGDTANFAIGQGDLLVTPLQIARMVAVFANKGYLVKPYIVKSIGGQDISVYKKAVTGLKLHDGRVDYIARAMRNVVLDPTGTANIVEGSGVAVAGKTGTVQVPRGQPHAWFAGFFPYKEPKYVICVFLEHGGSGQASCVLAKQIIGDILKEGLI